MGILDPSPNKIKKEKYILAQIDNSSKVIYALLAPKPSNIFLQKIIYSLLANDYGCALH